MPNVNFKKKICSFNSRIPNRCVANLVEIEPSGNCNYVLTYFLIRYSFIYLLQIPSFDVMNNAFPELELGGRSRPKDCKPRHKVGDARTRW